MPTNPEAPHLLPRIRELERWIRRDDLFAAVEWDDVSLVEDRFGTGWCAAVVPGWDTAVRLDEFLPRWTVICARVDRDWINLSAQDGVLLVVVDCFESVDPDHCRRARISVNLSHTLGPLPSAL